eukprot:12286751-Karenia_brevis.AAC.1
MFARRIVVRIPCIVAFALGQTASQEIANDMKSMWQDMLRILFPFASNHWSCQAKSIIRQFV